MTDSVGCATAQAVSRQLLTMDAQVQFHRHHMGFVVDKMAMGQVFFKVLQFSHLFYHSTNVPRSYSLNYH
jgi:hypothetical protein